MGTRLHKRPVVMPHLRLTDGAEVRSGAGAPTDGTSGTGAGDAEKGSLYLDITNGLLYQNTNTLASPTWTQRSNVESEQPVTATALAHSDASPFELLAADATNERLLFVRGVATEAAAGAPDIDIGSATTDPNGVVDDFGAGVWAVGDRFEGFIRLPAGEALDATIAAAGTAGEVDVFIHIVIPNLDRSQLVQDDLQSGYRVPLTQFRVFDAMETLLPGTAATDDMAIIGGTHGTAAPLLEGVAVAAASSETQRSRVTVCLPAEYVAGQTITLRARSRVTAAMNTAQTIDAEAVSNDDDGTVSADLVTTAAITLGTTFADQDFTITPTGLVAGDELDIRLTSVADDTGGSGTGRFQLARVELLLDVKG